MSLYIKRSFQPATKYTCESNWASTTGGHAISIYTDSVDPFKVLSTGAPLPEFADLEFTDASGFTITVKCYMGMLLIVGFSAQPERFYLDGSSE